MKAELKKKKDQRIEKKGRQNETKNKKNQKKKSRISVFQSRLQSLHLYFNPLLRVIS